ncbi:hypothetical protein [uncultured Clostridium sp.]|uniref:hypothetical protein n=1 Tax=uncultured Clostridium sp. TaxID=59620 RepID=UPI002601EB57|nr:hypothetical protein [uncultured Clostridium sp.]
MEKKNQETEKFKGIEELKRVREELEENIRTIKNELKIKRKENLINKLNEEIKKYEEIQYLIIMKSN